MRSTFSGIEIARRALAAQQAAINTVGHNIGNANTDGYSRQRVYLETTYPIPMPAFTNPRMAGQMGTGVIASKIDRIREEFLDHQFRNESAYLGYWDAQVDVLNKIEVVMNEPTDDALAHVMDNYWAAWKDLEAEPDSASNREVLKQRGTALVETFQHMKRSLLQYQQNMDDVIRVKAGEVNSYLRQLQELNDQIGRIQPHGYETADLNDRRDLILDKLSSLIPIKVEPASHGMIKISCNDVEILNERERVEISAEVDPSTGMYQVLADGSRLEMKTGFIQGAMEGRGLPGPNGELTGILPDFIKNLDMLAQVLTKEVNDLHRSGMNMKDIEAQVEYQKKVDAGDPNPGNPPTLMQLPFFIDKSWYEANKNLLTEENLRNGTLNPADIPDPQDASNLMVNPLIMDSGDLIAAAQSVVKKDDGTSISYVGDGQNAKAISGLKFKKITDGFTDSGTMDQFYANVIGELGIQSQESQRLQENMQQITKDVDNSRQSVSGVSLDDEMADLIKYQQAYNAAARNMTALDEMLDKVINGMGIVGR
ncbi:flagellar hook-associated protein FlgK [Rubeoparvulum massiliense]|uniref:flagellar hook-associated protein FlgK n=1 Tax=Rubeoparvulum massiliense TaxID=1631346 RepID=UPI00065E8F32|nr:flagellar hook-associated protein FlgK [Rubeoparvulum massiliense]